jgi:hypothetical protein
MQESDTVLLQNSSGTTREKPQLHNPTNTQMKDRRPWLCQGSTLYEDPTAPKQSMLLEARDWYCARTMIAGILVGVVLESTAMNILPKPLHLCIFFSWATRNWFSVLIIYTMLLNTIRLMKSSSIPRSMALCFCLWISAVGIVRGSVTTFEWTKKQEYTETERIFGFATMSSIYIVTTACGWLALATVVLLTTLSHYYRSCRRFFSFRRNAVVFVGSCCLGVNTCLFISSVIGLIPRDYNVMVCLSLDLGHSLVLFVVSWIQETIMFREMGTTKREVEATNVDDTLECASVC